MAGHRVYGMRFGSVHPLYVRKVERKGRSAEEVDAVIRWQTGYDQAALEARIGDGTDFRAFFDGAPAPNPARLLGVDAGRIEVGCDADLVLIDPAKPWIVDSAKMRAAAGNTPFDRQGVEGRATALFKGGTRIA